VSPTRDRVVPITGLGDPRLADYAHQTDVALRKARGSEYGLYLAESVLVLRRALAAGHVPRSVLALGNTVDEALDALADHPDVPIFVGPGELLAELTGYILHRGLIAAMNRPALPDAAALLEGARRVVVLENVADPTNVGAIFRSVGSIGADAVLVTPRCSDPFYRRAIRVSMGTVLQVPWTRVGDWDELSGMLTAAGFRRRAARAGGDRPRRGGGRAHRAGDRRGRHRRHDPHAARHRLAQRRRRECRGHVGARPSGLTPRPSIDEERSTNARRVAA
jgi:tRNA G18 (ribose-2'-O)-methylase SpoU